MKRFLFLLVFLFACQTVCDDCFMFDDEQKACVPTECCKDADCPSNKQCLNFACHVPDCEECQFVENHVCTDYDCCKNTDCANDEICSENTCTKIECQDCTYPGFHECVPYACCYDGQCDDSNDEFVQQCINPGTEQSYCQNFTGFQNGVMRIYFTEEPTTVATVGDARTISYTIENIGEHEFLQVDVTLQGMSPLDFKKENEDFTQRYRDVKPGQTIQGSFNDFVYQPEEMIGNIMFKNRIEAKVLFRHNREYVEYKGYIDSEILYKTGNV